jgi:hypothetical protein
VILDLSASIVFTLILATQALITHTHTAPEPSISPSDVVIAAMACVGVLKEEKVLTPASGWMPVESSKKAELIKSLQLTNDNNIYERNGLYLGYNLDFQLNGVRLCEISSDKYRIPEFETQEYRRLWFVFNTTIGSKTAKEWPDSTWIFRDQFLSLVLVTPESTSVTSEAVSKNNSLIYITVAPTKVIK